MSSYWRVAHPKGEERKMILLYPFRRHPFPTPPIKQCCLLFAKFRVQFYDCIRGLLLDLAVVDIVEIYFRELL